MSYGFKSLHPHQKLQNIRSVAFLFVEEPVFVDWLVGVREVTEAESRPDVDPVHF